MMNRYSMKTTMELFKAFAFENDRINQSDREQTQRLIQDELRRRMNRAMDELSKCGSEVEADRLYNNFINGHL